MTPNARPDLGDLSDEQWDVVVVGAGPGGAMAARELALEGARVLLVDKAAFPRYKVCGCCLNPRAARVLRDCGLGSVLKLPEVSPILEIRIATGGRAATLGLPAGGVILSRSVLDDTLTRAAVEAGAVFVDRTTAHIGLSSSEYCSLMLSTRHRNYPMETRIVIAANGLAHGLLRKINDRPAAPKVNSLIGAGAILESPISDFQHGVIYMACGAAGYVGLVRLEDGKLNVAAALDAARVRAEGGLHQTAHSIITDAGFAWPDGLDAVQWRGTPPLTRRASNVSGHRYFVLGDAAGYVEPFTGEGMAWALSAGKAVAPYVLAGIDNFDSKLIGAWSTAYKRLVSRSHRRCRVITAGLRRPRLVGLMVDVLSWAPQLAKPIVRQLNGPPNRKSEC